MRTHTHKNIHRHAHTNTGRPWGLTIAVFLTALPEACVEVSEGVLVLARFPDVVHSVGQLPLPDLGQLIPPCRGHGAVEGVLGGALWKTPHKKTGERLM